MAKRHRPRVDASCVARSAAKKNMDRLLLLRSVKADWEGQPLRFVQYVMFIYANTVLKHFIATSIQIYLFVIRVQKRILILLPQGCNGIKDQGKIPTQLNVEQVLQLKVFFNFMTPCVQRRKQCQSNDDVMPGLSPLKDCGNPTSNYTGVQYTVLCSVGVKL